MSNCKKEVLIIGGDHHNTLAVIRCLACEKVDIKVLIHGNFNVTKDIKISHSKYVKDISYVVDDEKNIYEWLMNNKKESKMFILPCSDLGEYTIDKNYRELEQFYIIPGFKGKPGKVAFLMDKFEQKRWADENNILMAECWNIKNSNNTFEIPKDIKYPCIIKPQVSALGEKSDIKIVDNEEKLKEALDLFLQKNYTELLLQKFLIKKFEICAHGCIVNNDNKYCGGIVKKLREYPIKGGSTALAQFINDKDINEFIEKIIFKLYNEGYRGMYDIDALVCEDGIYLNEINFRHSGNGYALIKNGIKAPYIHYLDMINENFNQKPRLKKEKAYHLDELGEWNLLKKKHISFREFIIDVYKSNFFAKLDKKDLYGGLAFFPKITKKI